MGRGVWGRVGTCICMAEPFHSSPETITTLLISYTSIQNKMFLKNDSHFLLQENNYIPEEENETLSETAIVDIWYMSFKDTCGCLYE